MNCRGPVSSGPSRISSAFMTRPSRCLAALLLQPRVEAWKDCPSGALEDLVAVCLAEIERIDVPLGVVEEKARIRILPADGPDHLTGKHDVVDVDDLEQQVDARLVVDAGVEPDVAHQQFRQL